MKRIITGVLALAALAAPSFALQTIATSQIVNGPVASTTTYIFDLKTQGVDFLSAQAVYSSATIATGTFTDGIKSTATITVLQNTGLVATASTDTITVASNTALTSAAGSVILRVSSNTLNLSGGLIGSTLTVAGTLIVGGIDYQVAASSNATAANIVTAINGKVPNVLAAISPVDLAGSSITITCVTNGAFCNTYTLATSTPPALPISSGTFTGGLDNASFTFNGVTLTNGIQWTAQAFSSNTALAIANAANTYFGYLVTAATSTPTAVTLTANAKGTAGNAFTLTSSTSALRVSSAVFVNGVDNAYLLVNGTKLTQGTDWTKGAVSSATANSIALAINSNATLSTIILSTNNLVSNVVFATATAAGVNAYSLYSSTGSITISTNTFVNGAATSLDLTNDLINIPSHGMATGLRVLISTPATGTLPTPLIGGTTYFVIVPVYAGNPTPDTNNVRLATTLANAQANTYIDLTAQTGGGTFTMAPLAINNVVLGIYWAASNDGVNFQDITGRSLNGVTVSSVTFSSTTVKSNTFWDFGQINARQLQLNVNAPGSGAYNVTVTPNGKGTQ